MTLIKRNLSIVLILPYFIAVTGMLVLDSGDKKLIPFIILSVAVSIILYKKELLTKNMKSPFIWLVSLLCGYAIFSYYYHSSSSREIRALIGASLFLIFFPYQVLTRRVLQWVVLIGAFTICVNSIYFNLYLGIARDAGYINPIPYSTACALISLVAFSLLLDASPPRDKWGPTIAFLLSLPPIILSEARGVWLAFSLSILIIIVIKLFNNLPSRKQLFFILTLTVSFTSLGTFLFKDNINEQYLRTMHEIQRIKSNDYNSSFGLRLQMWMLAPSLIQESPLLGHGSEQQETLQRKLNRDEISSEIFHFASRHYHNQFLDRLVKSGVIGLILTVGILLYPLMVIKYLPQLDRYIVAGLVNLFFIAGLTDVPFNHPQPLMLYLLFLVPICSRCKRVSND